MKLSFRTMRMGAPYPIVEFNWPVGKELPQDIRRLTVDEFHLALHLAAKCLRDVKDACAKSTAERKDKYESLVEDIQGYVHTSSAEYSQLKKDVEEQLEEVNGEIALIKQVLESHGDAEPEVHPQVHFEAQVEVQQKKRGRPKKQ